MVTESNKLPDKCTCQDCVWWKNCKDLIMSLSGNETTCDWTPSRFVLHPELKEVD